MRVLIHDLNKNELSEKVCGEKGIKVISDNGKIHSCIGCFGCWIKTPSRCVIKDGYNEIGGLLSKASEFIIVSRCVYGGFSPFVKNVVDRSLSYVHPYFVVENGEMHHKRRYDTNFKLTIYFYDDDKILENELRTAQKYADCLAKKYQAIEKRVKFIKGIPNMEGIIS